MTNNKVLITPVYELVHGISYTKLSEITTEVSKCLSGMLFLPPAQCQQHQFTMVVGDNAYWSQWAGSDRHVKIWFEFDTDKTT